MKKREREEEKGDVGLDSSRRRFPSCSALKTECILDCLMLIRSQSFAYLRMAEYAKAAYWDDRYTQDPETFEWFQSYDGIKSSLKQYINDKSRVLVVGCGNSALSEQIYSNLSKKVVSIDISEVSLDFAVKGAALESARPYPTLSRSFSQLFNDGCSDYCVCLRSGRNFADEGALWQ
jgi:hypothetical protein